MEVLNLGIPSVSEVGATEIGGQGKDQGTDDVESWDDFWVWGAVCQEDYSRRDDDDDDDGDDMEMGQQKKKKKKKRKKRKKYRRNKQKAIISIAWSEDKRTPSIPSSHFNLYVSGLGRATTSSRGSLANLG